MRKIPVWVIVVLVVAVLIGSKFLFFSKPDTKAAGPAKGASGMPVAVNYVVAKASSFSNDVFATGKVGALNQVDLVPEASGKVIAINFKEGETVNKGSLLVKLNDADLQAQLHKIRNQIKLSEAKLGRVKRLLEVNGVSREEYEMQENELSALKADEAYILAQIARTNIVAPFTGVVGLKSISEGSFVGPTTPVVSLVQTNPLFIEFSLPEKYSDMFKTGLTVRFSAEGRESAKTHTATIYAIEPRVDETTKSIRARALFKGEANVFPGSFVRVYVSLGETKNAIMLPSQCVIPTLKGQKVFVSRGNVAQEVPVQIGVRTEKSLQITEGVSEGDTIIATGLLSVRKDSKLKLLKPLN